MCSATPVTVENILLQAGLEPRTARPVGQLTELPGFCGMRSTGNNDVGTRTGWNFLTTVDEFFYMGTCPK